MADWRSESEEDELVEAMLDECLDMEIELRNVEIRLLQQEVAWREQRVARLEALVQDRVEEWTMAFMWILVSVTFLRFIYLLARALGG